MHKFCSERTSLKAIIRRNKKHLSVVDLTLSNYCLNISHYNKLCNYKYGQQNLTNLKFKMGSISLLCMIVRFMCVYGNTQLSLNLHL